MSAPLYIIGLDGGGTKTTAVLCSPDGAILAEAQGGPSNFQVIGVEKAASTILDLVANCSHSIGCKPEEIGSIVAGLTGAGRPLDQERMVEGLNRLARERGLVLRDMAVESDARIALEGAFGGRPGIITIAGTGSIVFGKDEKGTVHRAGGWGRLIGDEGSGYAIGAAAFREVARMMDGRGKKTKLARLFASTVDLGTQEAIINALYRQQFDIASVAPLVLKAAEAGDAVARRILENACNDLVEVIGACLAKMNQGTRRRIVRPLAFVGSLLTNENMYSRKVRSTIRRRLPLIRVQQAEASPVVGAALMAAARLHS
jgi:N-acetylglucosamine kinase-like BadF-type ATPase